MTDEKQTAPPAITPQSPAPRPDLPSVQGPIAVPPPPPSSVATDDRTHERYQGTAPSGATASPSDGGTGSVTSTIAAMRKAAKKVTSVVTGEGGLETGATPVVDAPSASAKQAPAQQPVRQSAVQPSAAPQQQAYAYAGTAAAYQGAPAQPQAQPQPQAQAPLQTTASHAGSARRVRLVVSRVNPWSVMKMAFLLSIAIGIITVVAAAVVWTILNGMHLFANVNDLVESVVGDETQVNVLQYVAFSRTMSMATLIAVANIVLITALSTLGAFLYNIAAALVGGVHVTLTDD
ncbi:hypothetical protein GCM10023221_09780 [Luteimicrobium xylanilyticum]|uniref:DUF3566 domain-containing protein n=1 Tax=Luteimicrobium xylanilyticum TaxID=1133546 RepID=A0A5P9QID6_9MICO|nr:DUF3566 domain-containing protein [Luteimicrobium xylanilyticum]QFV00236.1 uncharacterized protein KDY119_03774 [Luteimicrobium xylanilyticum]